ncbi:ABC transporter permease [Sphingomonas qomolangmaensis]|uniref:ABC transporter permease n=1 Tax=Sphingomonas qomolangmaensis TaxID=2918765 RepID=A0ABY5LAR0_9SPHN|nr:ABC transporter permease [Sphingomonas qomolangmaensis]UUL84058.1 ABC transporter permease [Sphingomonas qomolangmaensis]
MDTAIADPLGVFGRESIAELRKSLRLPQFTLPTIITPAVFYGLFAIALNRAGPDAAAYSLATFGVFAATGPALFGFGAGVAVERENGLIELKRVSPLPAGAYVFAKLVAAGAMAAMALALIYGLALLGGVSLRPEQWSLLVAVHMLSVVPFALLGFAVGMRLGSKGAIAAANALYLGFSILGGLWMPITILPGWMQQIAWATPSFHLGQLALASIGVPPQGAIWLHLLTLIAISAAAAWFAVGGWRRSPA